MTFSDGLLIGIVLGAIIVFSFGYGALRIRKRS